MKTAIFYVSKHGPTEKVAKMIGDSLSIENTTIIDLEKKEEYNLDHYNTVILGTSIHSGKIHRKMRNFITKNAWILLRKPLGLYLYCMDKSKAAEQLQQAYPNELKLHSKSCRAIGGEFNFERMGFIKKALVKKKSGSAKSISEIDSSQLDAFIKEMKK